ncbi:MAG: hypothetical protein Q8P56_06460 [Candidatus Uhrbacteria bacterium]|nr:hypothetical protein [Candidatus Uhrbacteria bacterium]
MTEKGGYNPFKKELRGDPERGHEVDPSWEKTLKKFKNQARLHIQFATPHIPDRIKTRVLGAIDLIDLGTIASSVEANQSSLDSQKSANEQFKTWMRINFIQRELGDIKEDVFASPELQGGQKLMFSQLIDELAAILDEI